MALSKQMYPVDYTSHAQPYKLSRRKVWHGYLLSNEERSRIDHMLGKALLDQTFCDRLLHNRDSVLLSEHGLTAETQDWLCSIDASSLSELAEAIAR